MANAKQSESEIRREKLAKPVRYLYEDRLGEIAAILKPLRRVAHFYDVCDVAQRISEGVILSSRDNLDARKPYKDRRLKSSYAENISFQYYEVWQSVRGSKLVFLTKSYLHLYVSRSGNAPPEEIACVHSDPMDEPSNPDDESLCRQCRYKKGPHVHVTASEDPLAHCHFPLYLPVLEQVLSSVESLTRAMAEAIDVVAHEIFYAYKNKT